MGNTAPRCTDSRTEFKCKVSFLSVATGTSLGGRHAGMHAELGSCYTGQQLDCCRNFNKVRLNN